MEESLVTRACEFARKQHAGVTRKFSKDLYFVHPSRVAKYVSEYTGDEAIIAAAYLHDIVEDTGISLREVEKRFKSRVASLVGELTNDEDAIKRETKTLYLIRKLNTMSDEALLIKLCDRLDNVSDFQQAMRTPKGRQFVLTYQPATLAILDGLTRPLHASHRALIERIRVACEGFDPVSVSLLGQL